MMDVTTFRYDYLALFRRGRFWLSDQVQAHEPIVGFPTIIASYDAEVRDAVDFIRSHFENPDARRPVNCLLLGPPGAGKSFLATKLAAATSVEGGNFITINCAHHGSVDELARKLAKIAEKPDDRKLVLSDECDVTLAGSSAMRYLIDPMYEGEDFQGRKFNKTVFLFCGSYLRNREIKHQIEDRASSLSVPKLLHDLMLVAPPSDREVLRDRFLASCMLSEFRERTAPAGNVVRYLRRLEKLPDFLSRINGPIIEIPDVARPLDVSTPHFVISSGKYASRDNDILDNPSLHNVRIGNSCSPQRLLRFVRDTELPRLPAGRKHDSGGDERFRFVFKYPWDAFLAFKNMMIIERLLRVCDLISRKKWRSILRCGPTS